MDHINNIVCVAQFSFTSHYPLQPGTQSPIASEIGHSLKDGITHVWPSGQGRLAIPPHSPHENNDRLIVQKQIPLLP